jgi:glycosyltransferase involved in cell wall biosynthesis
MRILFVTSMPPRAEAPGAIPLVAHAALTGLRERNDVTLVTAAGDEEGEIDAAMELRRASPDVHVVDRRSRAGLARYGRRARLARSWVCGSSPWRTVWFADPEVQKTIATLVRTRAFDVAAVQDDAMGVFHFPSHLPTVLTEYEVYDPASPAPRRGTSQGWVDWVIRSADRRRWRHYQPSVWQRFDRIEVFSRRDADQVAELAPDVHPRVRINPFGIELPEAADPCREDAGLVLFFGNYAHAPNVDAACWLAQEIMPRVRAAQEHARLVLLGAAAPEEVTALAGPGISVAGQAATMRPWLDSAAVVAAPLRTGGGMRMKVLHALAAGKAVVTTPRGAEGLALAGGEPPLLVAENAEALAGEIVRLLRDQGLRRALAIRARRFAAEQHSPRAYAARSEAVYAELIAVRQGSITHAQF